MDLRAMLNDSSEKKDVPKPPPRLHTSQSSYSERPPSYDGRQHSQTSYAADSRPIGYFPPQSPAQQNSASTSTPSAGTLSASVYGQSPGPQGHMQSHIPREGSGHMQSYPPNYHPPQSPAHHYPTTPSQAYNQYPPQQTPTYGTPYSAQPPQIQQRPPTRDGPVNVNGAPQPQHYMSPPSHHMQAPSTPLGPPTGYPRPSPQAQRPGSQGYEHYRRTSLSSVGSAHSYSQQAMSHPPPAPRDGTQRRTYSEELRRERHSESVSPKTIPRPTPSRQTTSMSSFSQDPPPQAQTYQSPAPGGPSTYQTQPPAYQTQMQPTQSSYSERPPEPEPQIPPLVASAIPPPSQTDSRAQSTSARPTPEALTTNTMTPQSRNSSLPPQPSPIVAKQPPPQPQQGLKRNASVISQAAPVMPPKKRIRTGEIPIWARSARDPQAKPIRFDRSRAPNDTRVAPRPESVPMPAHNEQTVKLEIQHPPVHQNSPAQTALQTNKNNGWEGKSSITNKIPYEELTKNVCDWIFQQIGERPPPHGAVYEIEAKIGQIKDTGDYQRVRVPVMSEAIFNKDMYPGGVKFESAMDENQHRHFNEYLNHLSRQSFAEGQTDPSRECLRASHTVEQDDFYELTPQGVSALPAPLVQMLRAAAPRNRNLRVRRTTNKRTNEIIASIIKARIADLEVYCPNQIFDYRLSINVEAQWTGPDSHLGPVMEMGGGQDRSKDRVSYRHLAYQIDLTQVSHMGNAAKEHELEVEISVDALRHELENIMARRDNNYEPLVRGFINNVRTLCREGSRAR